MRLLRLELFGIAALGLALGCGPVPPSSEDGGVQDGGGGGDSGTIDTTPPTLVSTVPTTGAANVAVNTALVVEFSEAMNTATVALNATPSITFAAPTWNSANTVATFAPAAALATTTSYTVTVAGKDVAGNDLSGLKTFSFTTAAPVDTTPPTISSTSPTTGAANVAVTSALAVEFSEAMNTATVTISATPTITVGAPTWNTANTLVTFVPASPLTTSTSYTVTVAGKDVAGNDLSGTKTFSFTTAAPPDTTPPTVASTDPTNNAVNVAIDKVVAITFSEAMDTGTVTLTMSPALDMGTPTFSADNKTATFDAMPAPFATSTTYTGTVAGKDPAGNDLSGTKTFSFTTAAPPDTTPPTVAGTSPANSDTNVSVKSRISVTFSEPMNRSSVEGAFGVSPTVTCAFAWSTDSTMVTCVPAADLAFNTLYTVTIGTGARDPANNALAAAYSFSFRTATAPDTTPPTITTVSPANGATGVAPTTSISVTFSEAMDLASAQTAFQITSPGGVTGTFSWDSTNKIMTFSPSAAFAYGQTVNWRVTRAAKDPAGNQMAADQSYSFRVIRQNTVTLTSAPSLDGYACSNGNIYTSSSYIGVGEGSTNVYCFGFYTFDLSSLPPTLTAISSATLYAYQYQTVGLPYTNIGPTLYAQSIDYGLSLTTAAMTTPILQTQVCRIICNPRCSLVCTNVDIISALSTTTTAEWKSASATTKVRDDWTDRATRGNRSQYRLKFSNNGSAGTTSDFVYFYTGDQSTASLRPYLSITYEQP